jgi:hypothetical protein
MSETRHAGLSPRLVAALMMAVTGAGFFFIFLLQDVRGGVVDWSTLPRGLVIRYVVAMGIGGGLAGWLLAGLFGRGGVLGWVLALVGGILATLFAGLLGSAAGLLPDVLADGWQTADLIPILYGIAVVPLTLFTRPFLLVVWLALIVVTHLWARQARVERRAERRSGG